MSKKNHSPGPVPSGNRPKTGINDEPPEQDESGKTEGPKSGTGDQQQDEQRRLGEFTGKGEPARKQ